MPIRRSTPIERATRLESGQDAAIRVPALAAADTNVALAEGAPIRVRQFDSRKPVVRQRERVGVIGTFRRSSQPTSTPKQRPEIVINFLNKPQSLAGVSRR